MLLCAYGCHSAPTAAAAAAFAGQFLSNLLFFESQMGWRGLCVEGSPLNFVALVRNRPLCAKVNAVVGTGIASAVFYTFQRDGSWESAMSCMRGSATVPACADDAAAAGYAASSGTTLVLHTVPGFPLSALFARANISVLGWASVDVEGAEEAVFGSADWGAAGTPAHFISYEGLRPAVAAMLSGAGYLATGTLGVDALYLPGPALAAAIQARGSSGGSSGSSTAADAADAALAARSGGVAVNVTAQIEAATGGGLLRAGQPGRCLFHSQTPHYQDRGIFERLGGTVDAASCRSSPIVAPPLPSEAQLCACVAPPASANAFGLAFLEIGALDGASCVRWCVFAPFIRLVCWWHRLLLVLLLH